MRPIYPLLFCYFINIFKFTVSRTFINVTKLQLMSIIYARKSSRTISLILISIKLASTKFSCDPSKNLSCFSHDLLGEWQATIRTRTHTANWGRQCWSLYISFWHLRLVCRTIYCQYCKNAKFETFFLFSCFNNLTCRFKHIWQFVRWRKGGAPPFHFYLFVCLTSRK